MSRTTIAHVCCTILDILRRQAKKAVEKVKRNNKNQTSMKASFVATETVLTFKWQSSRTAIPSLLYVHNAPARSKIRAATLFNIFVGANFFHDHDELIELLALLRGREWSIGNIFSRQFSRAIPIFSNTYLVQLCHHRPIPNTIQPKSKILLRHIEGTLLRQC